MSKENIKALVQIAPRTASSKLSKHFHGVDSQSQLRQTDISSKAAIST
jgi:hypothetical protein